MEEKPDRYFHIENITKNAVTTFIGTVLMLASALTFIATWFVALPLIEDKMYQLGIVFILGFALLFMRDKITTYIDIFTKKKIG